MKAILVIILCLSTALAGCRAHLSKAEITSVSTPLYEQQLIIWGYENLMECRLFSPCFDAIVDGALQRDPARAKTKCQAAIDGLQNLSVSAELPGPVRTRLDKARQILQRNAAWSLQSARFTLGEVDEPPGFIPDDAQTCDAFALVDQVNAAYGLKVFMQGQYINCEVLNSGWIPVFPTLEELE